MIFRLIFLFIFLFSLSEASFSSVKKLASIKPIAEIESTFGINFHDSASNEIVFALDEVVIGLEATVKDNVLLHIDFEVSGDTGDLASREASSPYGSAGGGVGIEPGEIFAEVTFSNVYPFYLRVGKFKLGTTIIHNISPFLKENNFISEASLINNLAMEFGYSYGGIFRIAAGGYYVDNIVNRGKPGEWYSHIDNYYAYLNYNHIDGDFSLILNIGLNSNLSDSEALGYKQEKLSTVLNAVVEIALKYKEGHFLIASSFPELINVRFEGAYEVDAMTAGIYTNFRLSKLDEPLVIKGLSIDGPNFKPPIRIGAMFAYNLFEGFSLGVEAYYDFYVQVDDDYDANLSLVLTYALPDYTFYF